MTWLLISMGCGHPSYEKGGQALPVADKLLPIGYGQGMGRVLARRGLGR